MRVVVGRHRLTGFRVQGVHSPAVQREFVRPWRGRSLSLWESREDAERAAGLWNTVRAEQAGVRQQRRRDLVVVLGGLAGLYAWVGLRYAVPRLAVELFGSPPDLTGVVGAVLRDRREVEVVGAVLVLLGVVVEDLGPEAADEVYRDHLRWGDVVTAAAAARDVLARPFEGVGG
ncbi:SCO4402 family protein [Streptoalloteichus hindustanus]|uniref:SCO4402 family protein n=1 Tax=Streptoalloteichus hindustanus TaxID=2017 RepID=UPI001160FEE3|nr:hypothetical protein [Streptoalloteichus hindustanus]